MPERRRTFGPVVLLGLGAGALTAVAGNQRTVTGQGRAGASMDNLLLTFDGHLPLVTALGLVVLACWGVVLVTRGRVRRAVAGLGVLAAAGALVDAIVAYPQLADQLREDLAQIGVTGADVAPTAWYWAAVAGAVLSVVATALAVAWTPAWPEMGSRYDAPAAAAPAPDRDPGEQSSLDLWKAMDEGRDPTAGDPE